MGPLSRGYSTCSLGCTVIPVVVSIRADSLEPKTLGACMVFVAQAGNDNYIDFLSAHMLLKFKLINLRGIVPIWGGVRHQLLISSLVW